MCSACANGAGIEYRWAEGHSERYTAIAEELVRLKVDVIFAPTTPAVIAAKQATSTIPIVFATASDPVGAGLVESLSRPGGLITGLSMQAADTAGKRLEILREVVPNGRRLAILSFVGNPSSVRESHEVKAMALTLGLEAAVLQIRRVEDIAPTLEPLKDRADFLYVVTDPIVNANVTRINIAALGARLPTMHALREYVEAGAYCRMDQILRTSSGARATTSTRFCGE